MLYLLDENVAICCAKSPLYTAQRTVLVQGLGRQAPDEDILRFAAEGGFVLVTRDGDDFEDLMRRGWPRVAMVVLPGSAHAKDQRAMLERATPIITRVLASEPHKQFSFSRDGSALRAYDL